MKHLLIIFTLLLTSISWSKDVDIKQFQIANNVDDHINKVDKKINKFTDKLLKDLSEPDTKKINLSCYGDFFPSYSKLEVDIIIAKLDFNKAVITKGEEIFESVIVIKPRYYILYTALKGRVYNGTRQVYYINREDLSLREEIFFSLDEPSVSKGKCKLVNRKNKI